MKKLIVTDEDGEAVGTSFRRKKNIMTVKEARERGYVIVDSAYAKGYMHRKGYDADAQQVYEAGGSRKGLLYYEAPDWHSSRWHRRIYLDKEVQ